MEEERAEEERVEEERAEEERLCGDVPKHKIGMQVMKTEDRIVRIGSCGGRATLWRCAEIQGRDAAVDDQLLGGFPLNGGTV